MWFRDYQDFEKDSGFKKECVTQGKGIVGCEMHELVGWGEVQHETIELNRPKSPGVLSMIAGWLFGADLKRR